MVNGSRESPDATERRIRQVLRNVEARSFSTPFAFFEFSLSSPRLVPADALAYSQDGYKWSALLPTTAQHVRHGMETYWMFRFHFPTDLDNSGFVGWLATRLKTDLGTGVIVVCGSNSERGGIYDYWGLPYDLKAQAIELLASLGVSISADAIVPGNQRYSAPDSAMSTLDDIERMSAAAPYLGGVAMAPISTTGCSIVSSATRLRFEQRGKVIYAKYVGGQISEGYLLGHIHNNSLNFRYIQATEEGNLDSGVSTGKLFYHEGRLRMQEDYQWITKPGEGTNVFEECSAGQLF